MATYNLFPSQLPDRKSEDDHIPRYREMHWDQLRTWVATLDDVSAKQKQHEIIADLDERYGVTEDTYAQEAWDMNTEEYQTEVANGANSK